MSEHSYRQISREEFAQHLASYFEFVARKLANRNPVFIADALDPALVAEWVETMAADSAPLLGPAPSRDDEPGDVLEPEDGDGLVNPAGGDGKPGGYHRSAFFPHNPEDEDEDDLCMQRHPGQET